MVDDPLPFICLIIPVIGLYGKLFRHDHILVCGVYACLFMRVHVYMYNVVVFVCMCVCVCVVFTCHAFPLKGTIQQYSLCLFCDNKYQNRL